MTPAELRARRVGLGLTQGDVARLMEVDPRTVRRWESGAARAPDELRVRLDALTDRRDQITDGWVESGGPILIPADDGDTPLAVWWAAAAKALERLDGVTVTAQPPATHDGRKHRA